MNTSIKPATNPTEDPTKVPKSAGRVRVNQGLLSILEKKAIHWLAERLPEWTLPDHLTILGLIASVTIAIAYLLTAKSLHWIWLVNAGLIVHWFADSLDGTLARVRRIERKKHGFFVDHFSDAVSVLVIFTGLGFSPLMRMDIALLVIVAYYAHMILTYLKALVENVFQISIGLVGPTEARLFLFLLNIGIWYFQNPRFTFYGQSFTIFDLVGLVGGVAALIAFLVAGELQRRKLAKIDPLPERYRKK